MTAALTQAQALLASPMPSARLEAAWALHQQGQLDQAELLYQALLQEQPQHAQAIHMLATIALQRKHYARAVTLFEQAIELNPQHAGLHNHHGNALRGLQQFASALESYAQALQLQPNWSEALYNRGLVLLALKRLPEALASFEQVLRLTPTLVEAHNNRGNVLLELKQPKTALASFEQALQLKPDCAQSYNHRGNALCDLNLPQQAVRSYEQALELEPDYVEAHLNLARVLTGLKQLRLALVSFERALQLQPEHAEAHYSRSWCYLLMGDLVRGWQGYEWRWKRKSQPHPPRQFTQPLWLGQQDLAHQTILLYSEQGYGDTIQFARYAKQVARLGATVILQVPGPLLALLSSIEGVALCVSGDDVLPHFDYHCPLMSLPLAFQTDLKMISGLPYLPCPARQASGQESLPGSPLRKKIGLVWSGNPANLKDAQRSIPLHAFTTILSEQCDWYCLQQELRLADQACLTQTPAIHFLGATLSDFSATAALIAQMDLVITVDTSVAHLAGAMGKPVWILLPFVPDWRWMLGYADSPWYSSARLFRQPCVADWGSVLQQVAAEVQQFARAPLALNHVASQYMQGNALFDKDQFHLALKHYERALELKPDYMYAHYSRANALLHLNRWQEALDSIDRALQLEPDYAEAHNNRGIILQHLQRSPEALVSAERALMLKPQQANFYSNQGAALRSLNRPAQALDSYERALQIKPDYVGALTNRGNALRDLGRLSEALLSFEQASHLAPEHVDSHFNASLCHLAMGSFTLGWPAYEWRWKRSDHVPRVFPVPLWLGQVALQGKTILLHSEQGLGDTIQFCRYASRVAQLGATVVLEVPAALAVLLRQLDGVALVVTQGEPLPAFDYHCPLMSLALAFRTELASLSGLPYLRSATERSAQWQARLAPSGRKKVGLVWRGNAMLGNDQQRSIPLDAWRSVLQQPLDFYCLQQELPPAERFVLEQTRQVQFFGSALQDLSDTAALISLMDLVITVDTGVAHLAGAMGKEVWILLPFNPDWRWMLERTDSPWYDSARLLRQSQMNDWSDVLAQVATALESFCTPASQQWSALAGTTDVDLAFNTALRWQEDGQAEPALLLFQAIERAQPQHVNTVHMLAILAAQQQDLARAVRLFERAIHLQPDNVHLHHNLGNALQGLQLPLAALASYERALSIQPDSIDARYQCGVVLLKLKRLPEALLCCEEVLLRQAEHAEAHNQRGCILFEWPRRAEAVASYEQALRYKPDFADAHNNLGVACCQLGHWSAALSSFEQALRWAPQRADFHNNHGFVLTRLGHWEAALLSFEQALQIYPEYAEAYNNQGSAYYAMNALEAALHSFTQAQRFNPEHAEAHFNDSTCRLAMGDFALGWQQFEWRWKIHSHLGSQRDFPQTLWLGQEELRHRTILLHGEQGFGDTIQFCRYVTQVVALGATVLLEVSASLAPLMRGIQGVARVLIRGEVLPPFDYHCPMMSLALAFQADLTNLNNAPYLSSELAQRTHWQAQLGSQQKTRVGLAWRGSLAHQNDAVRSIPLQDLLLILDEQVAFYCLQKDVTAADQALLAASAIPFFGPALHDFSATAALIDGMDLVITVDTSVAHLAGAMGKEVWILLPYVADWRWLRERSDSPWYGSARLFRQTQRGDWASVLAQVAQALHKRSLTPPPHAALALPQTFEMAFTLHQQGQLPAAKLLYQEVLQTEPTHFNALQLLAAITVQQDDLELAVTLLQRAIAIDRRQAHVHYNLGIAYTNLTQLDAALASYAEAHQLQANYVEAFFNESMCRLLMGDFALGWQQYEWRWQTERYLPQLRRYSAALWLGQESLAHKTILLYGEQGLGDTIQFCRYAKQVAALGARVILEVPLGLKMLLRNVEGVAQLVTPGASDIDFDYHCPLMSLPLAFQTDLNSMVGVPYLHSDLQQSAAWALKLGKARKKRVGLVWSGAARCVHDAQRSIGLAQMMTLLVDSADYYCLQKECSLADQELMAKSTQIHFFGEQLADFSATAALLSAMDLVITVDTSVAHLAGAMGKEVWILLPFKPDWRWLMTRDDSPWYDSAKLFRQSQRNDWTSVMAHVAVELKQFARRSTGSVRSGRTPGKKRQAKS